ncbi:MAG: hypothetical protein J6R38_00165 [Alistipes sp.]|nr:hypothetical protein [Alistipes sp.]MBO5877929.1 hypothetical protein [Alistipes sp.]
MKRFILWVMILLATTVISSCERDEARGRNRTFYKVETNLGHLNPLNIDLYFYEYDDYGYLVNQQVWEGVPDGEAKSFRPASDATQLVIYLEALFYEGTLKAYLAEVFQLTERRTEIVINGETQITEYNPI